MAEDDVRVPAGWYPDPLGLPQLRWWDNHAWTEHISDARQPMTASETVTTKLAYADDEPVDERPFEERAFDGAYASEADQDLSRRERRERERLAEADDDDLEPISAAAAFADPVRSLEAPERDQLSVDEPSPAVRLAASGQLEDAPTSMAFELDTRFDDLLGESAIPRSAFAHIGESAASFVPDFPIEPQPQQQPQQQWSVADVPPQRFLTEVATNTGPAWVMTLLPVYILIVGLLMLLSGSAAPTSSVLLTAIFGIPYVAGIVLAILDYRGLKAAGIERPASWAWSFLSVLVYLIARLTRTARESGSGFGPMLTFLVLGIVLVAANLAVPGLVIQLSPQTFSHQAEVSIAQSASILGTKLTAKCPAMPPLIPQQAFICQAHKPGGATYDVKVSLQRSNGWIDWRVDDWGVLSPTG
ncbi:MAG: DUF2510 domain-containing protein [Actinomycetota bacterium]|nr:DUF2510 domain-containing protein [Actinomycetota bacterium]